MVPRNIKVIVTVTESTFSISVTKSVRSLNLQTIESESNAKVTVAYFELTLGDSDSCYSWSKFIKFKFAILSPK